jgi:hypothetical protein
LTTAFVVIKPFGFSLPQIEDFPARTAAHVA